MIHFLTIFLEPPDHEEKATYRHSPSPWSERPGEEGKRQVKEDARVPGNQGPDGGRRPLRRGFQRGESGGSALKPVAPKHQSAVGLGHSTAQGKVPPGQSLPLSSLACGDMPQATSTLREIQPRVSPALVSPTPCREGQPIRREGW